MGMKTMTNRALAIPLVVGALLLGGTAGAQAPPGTQALERHLGLDNESVLVVLLTYQPGAGVGRHLGLGPEMGIVIEGEVRLETPKGVETFKAGSVYFVPPLIPHDVRNESGRPAKVWDM